MLGPSRSHAKYRINALQFPAFIALSTQKSPARFRKTHLMLLDAACAGAIIGVRSADIALNIILARHCDPGRLLTVLTSEALT